MRLYEEFGIAAVARLAVGSMVTTSRALERQ
jgi:hypothetical protein